MGHYAATNISVDRGGTAWVCSELFGHIQGHNRGVFTCVSSASLATRLFIPVLAGHAVYTFYTGASVESVGRALARGAETQVQVLLPPIG